MASRTAWVAGNGVALTWSIAASGTDLTNLSSGNSVMSTVADITNGTSLDIYADISARFTIASTAIGAGAHLDVYLVPLLDDAVTYGDGLFTSGGAGTQVTGVPAYAPIGIMQIRNATLTLMAGFVQGIIIPPGSFRFALANQTGTATSSAATNCALKYRTYNLQLNN